MVTERPLDLASRASSVMVTLWSAVADSGGSDGHRGFQSWRREEALGTGGQKRS